MALHGFSPKVKKNFVAVVHPLRWLQEVDISLLAAMQLNHASQGCHEEIAELNTRQSSRLLKLVQNDLSTAGFACLPSWTDLRHMWSIRAEVDGMERRTAALAQAHSERMATMVYLRHGEQRQVLAGIHRFATLGLEVR